MAEVDVVDLLQQNGEYCTVLTNRQTDTMATAQHKDAAVLPLVLQFVSVEDIAAASTVCKEWRDMAAQDTTIGSVVWHGGVSTVQQVCVASSLALSLRIARLARSPCVLTTDTPSTTTPTQAGFLRHVLRGDSFREHNAVLTHTLKHPSSASSKEAAATLDAATRNGLLTNANLVALHGNRRQRRRLMEALSLLHQYATHTHTHESGPLLTLPKPHLQVQSCRCGCACWQWRRGCRAVLAVPWPAVRPCGAGSPTGGML